MPDDTDFPEEEAEEHERWKLRQQDRVRIYNEEKQEMENELIEVERMRNLTDQERLVEINRMNRDELAQPPKQEYKFMQKSYKVGVYYMDQAKLGGKWDILNRDYNVAVGEDKFDKSNLPACK